MTELKRCQAGETLSDGISKLAGGSSLNGGGLAEPNAQTGTLSQGR